MKNRKRLRYIFFGGKLIGPFLTQNNVEESLSNPRYNKFLVMDNNDKQIGIIDNNSPENKQKIRDYVNNSGLYTVGPYKE